MKTLLNISIPTFNRPEFLFKCLKSIEKSINILDEEDRELVSVFISDNSENNKSRQISESAEFKYLNIIYSPNIINIGSDKNIVKCYLYPNAEYVMILGDDDFISENFFATTLPVLKEKNFPIIFLKSYGLTKDESQSRNDHLKGIYEFKNLKDVIFTRNIHLTFISNMIFRRENYNDAIVNDGLGTNLVQLNLVFSLLQGGEGSSLFLDANLVMSTRNNTGGYNPVDIFCNKFFLIMDKYNNLGLINQDLSRLKKRMLHTFYNRSFAQYIRTTSKALTSSNMLILDSYYGNLYVYKVFYRPLFNSTSKFSFFILSFSYVLGNIYFYPTTRTGDFYYHFKNFIKKLLC